ncbi:MAG TPA: penicillin-binding protein activator, partial [Rhodobacterales bacterium]|nr:penicillin-binding protein activator [Rhodobacterales bacterium]
MVAFLRGARKVSGAIIAVLSLVWLTACGGGFGVGGGGPTIDTSRPV